MAQPIPISAAMTASAPAFNARAVFTWKSDRYYRVYLRGQELFFIRTSGQLTGELVARQFGLLGMLVWSLIKKGRQKKWAAMMEMLDRTPLDELLLKHKHNFKAHPMQLAEQVLEPPGWFKGHGNYVARWRFTMPGGGERMTFQLATNEDVEAALRLLPPVTGGMLRIDLEWNASKKKYVNRGG
jgi:hypothetical protein